MAFTKFLDGVARILTLYMLLMFMSYQLPARTQASSPSQDYQKQQGWLASVFSSKTSNGAGSSRYGEQIQPQITEEAPYRHGMMRAGVSFGKAPAPSSVPAVSSSAANEPARRLLLQEQNIIYNDPMQSGSYNPYDPEVSSHLLEEEQALHEDNPQDTNLPRSFYQDSLSSSSLQQIILADKYENIEQQQMVDQEDTNVNTSGTYLQQELMMEDEPQTLEQQLRDSPSNSPTEADNSFSRSFRWTGWPPNHWEPHSRDLMRLARAVSTRNKWVSFTVFTKSALR
jgi:hypothetical protein